MKKEIAQNESRKYYLSEFELYDGEALLSLKNTLFSRVHFLSAPNCHPVCFQYRQFAFSRFVLRKNSFLPQVALLVFHKYLFPISS